MFHNMQKKTTIEGKEPVKATAPLSSEQNAKDMKMSADKPVQSISQNTTQTNNTQPQTNKDTETMNSPQTKDQETPTENRVDIPGNNFNRPAQPAASQPVSRPSYPGSYPGANTPSYGGQTANNAQADGRKLVIGQGISLSGEIESCDYLIVEGTVEAALKGASNMDISESGAFYGTVEIESATIAGRFEGDITVNGRLTVKSTGTIIGSVTYKELQIEAGAMIEGSVTPFDSQGANRTAKKSMKTTKAKVQQDNHAELPFADKAAS